MRKRRRARRLPLKDVAAAGGWKDVTTLLTCYQHADEATMLKVMESPVRLASRRAAGALEKQQHRAKKRRRPNTTEVAPGLSVAPPGLEPGLS